MCEQKLTGANNKNCFLLECLGTRLHLMLVMQDSKDIKRKLAETDSDEKLNATKAELQQR